LEATKTRDPVWVRTIRFVSDALATIAGAIVIIMVLNIVLDVAARNILETPIDGTFELTKLLYVPCAAVLPLAFVQVHDKHIRVDAVVDALVPRAHRFVNIIVEILCLLVAAWAGHLLLEAAAHSLELREGGITSEWVPVWAVRYAVAVGWLLVVPAAIVRIRELLRGEIDPSSSASPYLKELEDNHAE
jgi:TRAP-type C4-dicarboxylate transport system permease small subunit